MFLELSRFFQQFFRSWSAEAFPLLRGTPSGAWLIFNFNELNIKKFCSVVNGNFEFFSFCFKTLSWDAWHRFPMPFAYQPKPSFCCDDERRSRKSCPSVPLEKIRLASSLNSVADFSNRVTVSCPELAVRINKAVVSELVVKLNV